MELGKEVYQRAIDRWGKQFQINMAIEECSELITKLIKRGRCVNGATDEEICNEIADVEIMMEQLKLIFDNKLIGKRKKYKIDRLLSLLDSKCCICGKPAQCHVDYEELKHYCWEHYHLSKSYKAKK